jgi:hypothetical protein
MKLWLIFIYLCAQFVETVCIYEFLLEKTLFEYKFLLEKTLFEKINSSKWSQGSQDIDILKSAIFRVFSNGNEEIYFIYVTLGGKNRLKKIHI